MEQGGNGKWAYHSSPFTGSKSLGSNSKTIDNVRIYPSSMSATNWTWTPTGELRSVTDGSGMTNSYEYDGMGRLATVFDTDGKKVSSYEYHYTLPSSTTPDSYVKTLQYTNASGSAATETINYYDGLGRPWQTISVKAGKTDAGTATRNLCVRTDYDSSGRPYKTWLPFRISSVGPQTAAQPSESIYSDNEAFSFVEYDGSPLDRPRAEYGPGKKVAC
jgi:RHS Repeat.